jgi:hypothetical protein
MKAKAAILVGLTAFSLSACDRGGDRPAAPPEAGAPAEAWVR